MDSRTNQPNGGMDPKNSPDANSQKIAANKINDGDKQMNARNYHNALNLYTEAIGLFPDASHYGNRSACLFMMGNINGALKDSLVADCLDANRFADAFNRTIETNLLQDLEKKVVQCNGRNMFEMAVQHAKRALEIAPTSSKFKLVKAECMAILGHLDEAKEIMQSDPTSADALYIDGLCFYLQAKLEQAITCFERAIALCAEHSNAQAMAIKAKNIKVKKDEAKEYFVAGKYINACTAYTEALELDSQNREINAVLLFNRALCSYKSGLRIIAETMKDLNNALLLNPKYSKALLLRAKCFTEIKMFDKAIIDCETALSIDNNTGTIQALEDAKYFAERWQRDDYFVLGSHSRATADELAKAYRELSRIYHPDRHCNASEDEKREYGVIMARINVAFENVLRQCTRREDESDDEWQ